MLDRVSTGLPGLDEVIDGLRLGDNVVWQVDSIADYRHFVLPYYRQAVADKRKIVYFRFAAHQPLIDIASRNDDLIIRSLRADNGFEAFTSEVYREIGKARPQAFYIFDCLSDLLEQWSSDLMIGNFFRITCPYLFELDTVAYFALLRGKHAYDAIARIRETTQLLVDLYRVEGNYYIHPLKVWQRYSPTMFLPHKVEKDACVAISGSAEAAALFASAGPDWNRPSRQIDYWDRLFLEAAESGDKDKYYARLSKLLIGRESRIDILAGEYFELDDLIGIKQRQIGTGKIGGKAVGMLLARKILETEAQNDSRLAEIVLEPHDSFFLGSDLYYTYIVHNGWWKLRTEQKAESGYYSKAEELRQKLLEGRFPDQIRSQYIQMLDYFGQSPIIVRSSSLLEDDFGNAFAGKYESVFCANQGTPEERLLALESAVRTVFASMLDESALSYRQKRGLHNKDEQMAILIQRVSGSYRGQYFYPLIAGVGHSVNNYVWERQMDPKAGMLRIVFGMGTRAVDRVEGDYPRIIALDRPQISSYSSRDDEKTYSQHYADLIDLAANGFCCLPVSALWKDRETAKDLREVSDPDWDTGSNPGRSYRSRAASVIINFRKIIAEKYLINSLRAICELLESRYHNPVDIEFTANKIAADKYMINILQCRPLQSRHAGPQIDIPDNIDISNILFRNNGGFMGGNVSISLNYIIYVIPEIYTQLKEQERYQIARIIGFLNRKLSDQTILLLGPGRWGTTTPSMGVPVRFSEISNITVLGELAFSSGMMPELSFGSHFFQDLVEADIFYLSLVPQIDDNLFWEEKILAHKNILCDLLQDVEKWQEAIQVWNCRENDVRIYSDVDRQLVVCTYDGQVENDTAENGYD